ncbi:hypothetical protein ACU8KH_03534 [Lachancea thermotolerans]
MANSAPRIFRIGHWHQAQVPDAQTEIHFQPSVKISCSNLDQFISRVCKSSLDLDPTMELREEKHNNKF